mmetsp:Transcript_22875/g.51737  ORF Transcript_22875/g.51737 Transcript_22875/m.51737 type:complete len:213 (-) Transcript_22875:958-1596(-)
MGKRGRCHCPTRGGSRYARNGRRQLRRHRGTPRASLGGLAEHGKAQGRRHQPSEKNTQRGTPLLPGEKITTAAVGTSGGSAGLGKIVLGPTLHVSRNETQDFTGMARAKPREAARFSVLCDRELPDAVADWIALASPPPPRSAGRAYEKPWRNRGLLISILGFELVTLPHHLHEFVEVNLSVPILVHFSDKFLDFLLFQTESLFQLGDAAPA